MSWGGGCPLSDPGKGRVVRRRRGEALWGQVAMPWSAFGTEADGEYRPLANLATVRLRLFSS